MTAVRLRAVICVVACAGTACLSGGELLGGLWPANTSDSGPRIIWDSFAKPLPEIPFPNDVGTRADPSSPTGRRINVSLQANTRHEAKLRRLIDGLDGFGTYSPMWLRFDGRIDLAELVRVQNNDDAGDDAVYVVCLEPASASYGQAVLLDIGGGRFPLTLETSANYFANDPRAAASNLLFETVREEDANGNGRLDPLEDTDGDGVLDRPNLWGEVLGDGSRMEPYLDLITFYELETDTLILRSVFPLEERSKYAVLVTRRLAGADGGGPVRSPFATINHLQQTEALRPLVEDRILEGLGLELDELAFAWSFTTQSITGTVEAIRAGLYGDGPLSRLAAQFPARVVSVPQVDEPEMTDNVYTLDIGRLLQVLSDPTVLSGLGYTAEQAEPLLSTYRDNIDFLTFFEIESPAFLENDDGVFQVDAAGGAAQYGRERFLMMCAVPLAERGGGPPFPVVFYGHGYTSSRMETLGFAGSLGRFGLATCSIDAYGHGLALPELLGDFIEAMLAEHQLERFAGLVVTDRARDLNGDDVPDSGGDFWTSNTFHTRDVVRQSTIDHLQAIRVLRAFGTATMPVDADGDGQDDIAGDFDGDGIPELGGDTSYSMFGQSLGGILSAVLGSAEPAMAAVAPVAGGGGLVDLGARSRQGGVVQAVFLPLLGPLIVGEPVGTTGRVELKLDVLDVNNEQKLRFASVPDLIAEKLEAFAAGDRIRVTNLDNGEMDEVTLADASGLFRLQIAADYLDAIRIEIFRSGSKTPYRTIDTFESPDARLTEVGFMGRIYHKGDTLRVLQEGFGMRRGTPELRRLLGLAQMVVDPADPINWAPLYSQPRTFRPEGAVPTNILVVNTIGDMNVPINTGVALGRAAGTISVLQPEPGYGKSQDQVLIDTWVVEGLERLPVTGGETTRFETDPCHWTDRRVLFDIDEASRGRDPEQGPHLSLVVEPPECRGEAVNDPAWCSQACVPRDPLRATREHPWGTSGMRFPYVEASGVHGFNVPNPGLPFDYNRYQINQIGWFFATGGRELVDDVCLAEASCPFN